jgi:hypothetical protein
MDDRHAGDDAPRAGVSFTAGEGQAFSGSVALFSNVVEMFVDANPSQRRAISRRPSPGAKARHPPDSFP